MHFCGRPICRSCSMTPCDDAGLTARLRTAVTNDIARPLAPSANGRALCSVSNCTSYNFYVDQFTF